jgi:hypothetical protein
MDHIVAHLRAWERYLTNSSALVEEREVLENNMDPSGSQHAAVAPSS